MISWLARRWRAMQRRTDMTTLWPACKQYAKDLDDAKMAFFWHASQDPAWTTDYSEDDLMHFVDRLQ